METVDLTPKQPLRTATVKGVRVTFGVTALNGIFQFSFFVALARILEPADFGLLALAFVLVRPIQIFLLAGFERAVVSKHALERGDVAGLFWLSAGIGLILTVACFISAGVVSEMMNNTNLSAVLQQISPLFLIFALALPSRGLLQRRLQFGRLMSIDLVSYVVGFGATAISAAIAGFGVKSLTLAYVTQAILQTALIVWFAGQPLIWHRRIAALKAPLVYGFSVSGLSFLDAAYAQITTLFVGSAFGPASVGFYSRAQSLVQLPIEQLGTSLSRVLLGSFVAVGDDRERLRRGVDAMLCMGGAIIIPVTFGMAAAAHELAAVLLGSKWAGIEALIAWLALASGATIIGHLMAVLSEAQAQLRQKFLILLLTLLVLIASIGVFKAYGAVGIAIAAAFTQTVNLLGYLFFTARFVHIGFKTLLLCLLPGLAAGAASGGAAFGIAHALGSISSFIVLPIQIAACGLACVAVYRLWFPKLFGEILEYSSVGPLSRRLMNKAKWS